MTGEIQKLAYRESSVKKSYKIGNTSEDIKTLLIECLNHQNYNFIKQYSKSIGVNWQTIIKYIHKWNHDRMNDVIENVRGHVIPNDNKDLSFTERLHIALNYSNNYFEFSDNNSNLAE